MTLAEDDVDALQVTAGGFGDVEVMPKPSPGRRWRKFPNSMISHHGDACCDIARAWLTTFDFAQLNGGDTLSGPRWLRERAAWGPTVWPIHWCEAVSGKTADCGVHAALAHEAFTARGVTAFRAQFVQRYNAGAAATWGRSWQDKGASDHWIDGEWIYHEGNAVLIDGDLIKLWDGSSGCWIGSGAETGYGSLAAVRIESEQPASFPVFTWAGHSIPVNEWVSLQKAPVNGGSGQMLRRT